MTFCIKNDTFSIILLFLWFIIAYCLTICLKKHAKKNIWGFRFFLV